MLRDCNGRFIAAIYGNFCHISSPLQAELCAARRAVQFLYELQRFDEPVALEGDSCVAIGAVNQQEEDYSTLGPIINDIRGLLQGLENITINFVHREANKVAHRLARVGLECLVETRWNVEPPDLICDALLENNHLLCFLFVVIEDS